MADKKKKDETRYASVVLVDSMEYMVVIKEDWVEKSFANGFFMAETLDGRPILFGKSRITLLREVTPQEFQAWQEGLKAYRDKQIEKLREEGKLEGTDLDGKK